MTRETADESGFLGTHLGPLLGDGHGWILLTVAVGWALSIGVRFIYPTLVPFFRPVFDMDLAFVGLLMSMLWGAYAIGHVPGGILGDRIGEGNILVVSTLISALTVLLVAVSVNVVMLFFATVVFGLATALYGPTRFTIFTNIYPDRAGSAVGLTMAAGSLGNSVLPAGATIVATMTTWRASFAILVPLFLLTALMLRRAVPRFTSGPNSRVDTLTLSSFGGMVRELTTGTIPVIVLVQVTISFTIQGLSSFYPTYLMSEKMVSPEIAAVLFGLFFAFGAVFQPLSGYLLDRFGARTVCTATYGVTVLGLWAFPFIGGIPLLVGSTILISSIFGCTAAAQTELANSIPRDMRGTGLGTVKAGWMLVGATAPLIIGILAEADLFNEAFLLVAATGTVGLAVVTWRL